MKIERIAAFAHGGQGGNPAGIVLLDTTADAQEMQRVAAEVGYSETAFASPANAAHDHWRVRYFSPESEVPFCGHATIALGAVLGRRHGSGHYRLDLNDATISVEARETPEGIAATLVSPPTRSRAISRSERAAAMALLNLSDEDLDTRLPPAHIHAGADHLVFALRDRARLARMGYDLDEGRRVMQEHGLVTIMLVHVTDNQNFSARNAFASGGVLEDPATGAAAAAFAGYLRDLGWPHGGALTISQGEDMGAPSRIDVVLTEVPGAPVQVSGATRSLAVA